MKKKILIIDDEIDWVKMIAARLESENYEVVAAFDTLTGVSQTKITKPDLVLLDIMMPSGGGIKFLENIRGNVKTFNLKVIIITARSDQETRNQVEKLGISGYFVKPIDTAEVLEKIKTILSPVKKT